MDLLKEADAYCRSADGGVAVVIAKHPCLLDKEARKSQTAYIMTITEDCTGCRHCLDEFECPALSLDEADGRIAHRRGPLRRLRRLRPRLPWKAPSVAKPRVSRAGRG